MKRTDPHSIDEIITSMMEQAGMTDEFARRRISYLWAEVVGPAVNRFTARRYVDGTTLHVYITSAALKSELSFLVPRLVDRLNEAVGQIVITDIVIH